MSVQFGIRFLRGLLLGVSALNLLACSEVEDIHTPPLHEPGPDKGSFYIIPELLTDSGQPSLLAVDRINPEFLVFATVRDSSSSYLDWDIAALGDRFYKISIIGWPQDEPLALSVVDDGIYNKVVMSDTRDFSGQKWQFTHLENGYCRITAELLGLEMALTVVNDTESSRLTMTSVSNDPGQHWELDYNVHNGILNDPQLRCAATIR